MLKLVSPFVLSMMLSGCFSSNEHNVVIIDKSINQHNITQQTTAGNNKPKKQHKKPIVKPAKSWSIPVKATIAKGFSKEHLGLSFNTRAGQTIHAVRDGTVVYSGDKMKSHGKIIIIKHPFGFYSTYTQNQSLKVAVGSEIKKGQVIAFTSKQPFYFEMKKFSSSINPAPYLK